MLAAGKNRFAARMISVQPFSNIQYLLQVLAQNGVGAIALGFAQRIAHQVFRHDGFFTVRLVLRRLRLKVKTDGASRRRLKLRQLTDFFTHNHSRISFVFFPLRNFHYATREWCSKLFLSWFWVGSFCWMWARACWMDWRTSSAERPASREISSTVKPSSVYKTKASRSSGLTPPRTRSSCATISSPAMISSGVRILPSRITLSCGTRSSG